MPAPFNILITNGRIFDGTGNPWFRGDVGIRGDRIIAVGKLNGAAAKVRIDAANKAVSPGFVDAHVHGDLALFTDPLHEPAIRQGVTTYVLGQDGVAMAPASPTTLAYMCRYTAGFSGGRDWPMKDAPTWSTMAEYLAALDRRSAVNAVCLVPNGNVRHEVMRLETRQPTPDELKRMGRLVREAMEQGAVGLSSGLDYIPSRYADTAELTALCREIEPFGGVYVTHMRRYDPDGVVGSMDEVFQIGRDSGAAVHISHFNSRADLAIPRLDAARADGIDATFDLYCYLAGSTILAMVTLPPWVQEGGAVPTLRRLTDPAVRARLHENFASPRGPLETVRLSYISSPEYRQFEGKTLPEAVGSTNPEKLSDFVCDVLIASEMAVGCVVPHLRRTQADVDDLMRHPAMMGGSDGIYTGSCPHPRGCGCFAHYLGHHVRNGTWPLETAVQRLSYHTARRFGLRDRGLLAAGYAADVVVFDPDTIADLSTYDAGKRLAVGVEHVLVNGELVLHDGQRTKTLPGRGLKRG